VSGKAHGSICFFKQKTISKNDFNNSKHCLLEEVVEVEELEV
jgi:hypothetical protein